MQFRELPLLDLFFHAHVLVQAVMGGLLLCSVFVWGVAIEKTLLFSRIRKTADRFERKFAPCRSWEDCYALYRESLAEDKSLAEDDKSGDAKPGHSIKGLFVAVMRECVRSIKSQARAGLQMRIEKVRDVTIAREIERMERWLLVLATVGSAGPFIGLFGTVFGIMMSFYSIAASQSTSLAVVAPGIAEALLATAIGLVAAIPATIFYNIFASEVNRQAQRLEGFADQFTTLLSRQIDELG